MASILLSTEVLKEIIRRCPTWKGPGQIDREGAIVVMYSPMRRKNSLKKERGLLQNTIILEQDQYYRGRLQYWEIRTLCCSIRHEIITLVTALG